MKGNSPYVIKISKYLREQITNNILKSGEHTSEKSLAEEFSVSRVPVRESLRILQSEGYLEFIPNKGCYVKKISPEFVYQSALVYTHLAPVILKKAIPNYTDKTYIRAEKTIDKIERSSNNDNLGYLLWGFATIIYSPSRMKFMLKVFDSIYQLNMRFLNEFFVKENIAKFNVSSHRKFIDLCKQNNPEEAIKHWSNFLSKLNKLIVPNKTMSK